MLNHSFIHMPFIGTKTENRIWNSGIFSINDFLDNPPDFLSKNKLKAIIEHIYLSIENIQNKEADYFYRNLSSKEQWRIFREFQDSTVYLDIETTGLGEFHDITTIALYDGKHIRYYINGINLNDFKKDILDYRLIVTYNGKSFDIPFIERYFGIKISQAHLDLRFILYSIGFSGGLKSCERQLGIGRSNCLSDIDGYFAVLLWNDYKSRSNEKALETLLSYNIQDVLNLEYLMAFAYNRKLRNIPLKINELNIPQPQENPFKVDPSTVNKIKALNYLY